MGLDIYFKKVKKDSPDRERCEKLQKEISEAFKNDLQVDGSITCEYGELYRKVYENVAYFRKVNFLVDFFKYDDDCSIKYVTKEKIEELVEKCEQVLALKKDEVIIKARDILPTCVGFFFGSYEYDDWYLMNVKEVRREMKRILGKVDFNKYDIALICDW